MNKIGRPKSDTKTRFLSYISNITTSGCWEWKKSSLRGKYGRFFFDGKVYSAHRAAYIIFVNKISGHLLVCHKCDNRRCANPEHLFIGTQSDNLKDMVSKGRHYEQKKTHCKHGHEFSSQNTYVETKNDGRKFRRCKKCRLIRYHKSNHRTLPRNL